MVHLKESLTSKLMSLFSFPSDLRLRWVKTGDFRNSYLRQETDKVYILSWLNPGMIWVSQYISIYWWEDHRLACGHVFKLNEEKTISATRALHLTDSINQGLLWLLAALSNETFLLKTREAGEIRQWAMEEGAEGDYSSSKLLLLYLTWALVKAWGRPEGWGLVVTGRSWKADSRESFPERNDAMAAALNLEVIFFFIPCGGEPVSRRFSFQKFTVLSI